MIFYRLQTEKNWIFDFDGEVQVIGDVDDELSQLYLLID
jgi:hypothetical protein